MDAALEACGEFLCRLGALEEAKAIEEMLRKTGVKVSESYRWRALVATLHQEFDADIMDIVFIFERLVQLDASMPSSPSAALFQSPLFLHLLVKRFEVAFEGLDAELFKLESDELWQADGIYETCELIRDRIAADKPETELGKFLAAFKTIFQQDEPKECWEAFSKLYFITDLSFRRDMKRALHLIEAATLGPTKLELAFPTEAPKTRVIIPRALIEKRFTGTRQDWRNLSPMYSLDVDDDNEEKTQDPEEQAQVNGNSAPSTEALDCVWSTRVPFSLNGEATESVRSEVLEDEPVVERSISSRPLRVTAVARNSRQEDRRSVPRASVATEVSNATEPTPFLRGRRTTRKRWSKEEEAALIEGYESYQKYANVWVLIKTRYANVLADRTNVDLKDKYRNLIKYGKIPQSSTENGRHENADNEPDDNIVQV